MKNEHNIDELFKSGLEKLDIPFNEKDWEDMVKKLEAEKKKRILSMWWLVTVGVAAALLILLFTVLFEQQPAIKNSGERSARNSGRTSLQNRGQIQRATESVPNGSTENKVSPQHNVLKNKLKEQPIQMASTAGLLPKVLSAGLILAEDQEESAEFIQMKIHEPHSITRIPKYADIKHRAVSFSIMAAPDISTTSANLSSRVSTNIGLLVTYPITNKISISTGLIYARKLYNSGGVAAMGNGYMNNSWEMNADCRVLDIPLNINYQVFKKQKLSVSINTGLSSYLMLNERYELKNGQNTPLSTVEVRNRNQHPFSVANLSVGVERKINSSLSIGLEPFIKLPLTGVGDYDARLKSTGIAVSLNFNILGRK